MQQEEVEYFTLECPNTIFYIYIQNEFEGSKVRIFLGNMRYMRHLKLNDIYTWCNHQKISYETQFNYNRSVPLWKNLKSYVNYLKQKTKYQENYQPV